MRSAASTFPQRLRNAVEIEFRAVVWLGVEGKRCRGKRGLTWPRDRSNYSSPSFLRGRRNNSSVASPRRFRFPSESPPSRAFIRLPCLFFRSAFLSLVIVALPLFWWRCTRSGPCGRPIKPRVQLRVMAKSDEPEKKEEKKNKKKKTARQKNSSFCFKERKRVARSVGHAGITLASFPKHLHMYMYA